MKNTDNKYILEGFKKKNRKLIFLSNKVITLGTNVQQRMKAQFINTKNKKREITDSTTNKKETR